MYLRAVHAESDVSALHKFLQANPLGVLITGLQSPNFPTLQCTHIPWVLDVDYHDREGGLGKLRGHLARQNPHSKALIEAAQREAGSPNASLQQEVSVLFNGLAHSYVTPQFYVDTKPATGKVVPTWNYSAAQVYGKATIFSDMHSPSTNEFLQKQIEDITNHSERTVIKSSGLERNSSAWEVNDAPPAYIEIMKAAIIGIEIVIERLEGKYKMSQEMGKNDRKGVVEGFALLNTDTGLEMAKTVEERGAMKDARSAAI